MHILEIASFIPPYGGYFSIEQACALQARGHEVRLLCCLQLGVTVHPWHFLTARLGRWEEEWPNRFCEGKTLTVFRTNMRGLPRTILPNKLKHNRIVGEMYDEYVRRYGRPDIIHAHCCQWAGTAAREISEREGIPFVITEHIMSILYYSYGEGWSHDQWARQLISETYGRANCVVPVAEELVEDLAPLFGRDYRWRAISNVTDVDFYAYRDRAPLDERPFRFCCLARADIKGKGLDVLHDAFKGFEGAELHIAGRHTTRRPMRQLYADVEHVTLHGELGREAVRELLYNCDALVLPTRREAQPLVLLEAMSTGIPVVTTDVIPQCERIPGACFVARVGDAGSLREKMREVMHVRPSVAFHQAVRDMSSHDVVAAQLETLFSSFSSSQRHDPTAQQ